jgi:hypothetical protein
MVRGTADPSAALGMTKGRAMLPWRAVAGQKVFFITLGGRQGPWFLCRKTFPGNTGKADDWFSAAPTALGSSSGFCTALPRISCGTWWLRCTSCAFLHGKAHTRFSPVQRGRKSGSGPCTLGDLCRVISVSTCPQRKCVDMIPIPPNESIWPSQMRHLLRVSPAIAAGLMHCAWFQAIGRRPPS